MEFLNLGEVRERAPELRRALDQLLRNRALVSRVDAAQWQFLRLCLDRTLGESSAPVPWGTLQAAQYKFEIETKLRRLYLRGGEPLPFIFRLVSRRDAQRHQLVADANYPETAGYHLLVRERRDPSVEIVESLVVTREYIEMVVTSCIDAEFDAYKALPMIDVEKLHRYFAIDGPAYRDVLHLLQRHAARGWVLTNFGNPSTKRLLAINVKEIRPDHVVVRTTEYWYLRWWGTMENRYCYPYRETNTHTYILKQVGERLVVVENIMPPPISSTPHRR